MPAPIREVKDVVRALQRSRSTPEDRACGRAVFLVGAGCSRSAGIPMGLGIARNCVLDLARRYSNGEFRDPDPEAALAWLKANGGFAAELAWPDMYGYLFEHEITDASEQQRIFREATRLSRGQTNWAHLCLGELVYQRYVHTVITTNFDQLVLDGVIRTGLIPVVADGVESLARVEGLPEHPQVIHWHGSRHTYNLRNSTSSVLATSRAPDAVRALRELLRDSFALIVIGYAGGEEGVMQLLVDAARDLREKTIYWIQYSKNPEELSRRAQELLSYSPSGGLVIGQDADEFFRQLMQGLKIGVPGWMKDVVAFMRERDQAIVRPENRDIQKELDQYFERLDGIRAAYQRAEKRREEADKALAQAREHRLAGRGRDALAILREWAPRLEQAEPWEELGELAVELGADDPDPALLQEAVGAFQHSLEAGEEPSEPDARPRRFEKLGSALWRLGEREAGSERLQQAVVAFQAALQGYPRATRSLEWAAAQVGMANALCRLGEREAGSANLEAAVAAYRAVLEVYSREGNPLNWAMVQGNLGAVLWMWGEREPGSARLEESVAAYTAALEIRTRERLPNDWADTQNNLGVALRALGDRKGEPALWEQAVAAYRAALEVRTRARVPLDWASTQNNLGSALRRLGEHEEGGARLKEAIAAYRAALEVRTPERVPLDWAATQDNLGVALWLLGKRETGRERLEEAQAALQRAIEVYERVDWTAKAEELRKVLTAVGEELGKR